MVNVGANSHLRLEHYLDCLIVEAGQRSDHVQNARKQVIAFVDVNYRRKLYDRDAVLEYVKELIDKYDLIDDLKGLRDDTGQTR